MVVGIAQGGGVCYNKDKPKEKGCAMMKKISLILVLILVVQLLGCAAAPGANVETLKGWSFQYNEGTNDYSVFFALLDQKDRYIAAEVDVDIRIVNDREETVYQEVHSVTKDDFSNYYSQAAGEQFLANVRIPAGDIKLGSASDGTVYLNIYIGDVLWFDEVNCEAWNCLPIKEVRVQAQGLPQEVEIKDYDGSTASRICIEEVTYVHEKEYGSQVKITVSGTKTYGNGGSLAMDMVNYKLLDSEGYVVDSGTIFLDGLSEGDKFRDDSILFFDAIPGETYTIVFSEHSW